MVAAGHPLDLIKVNMQTMPKPMAGEAPMYTGMLDCARKIVAQDGVRYKIKVSKVYISCVF